jgi:hypothetical protein
MAWDLGAGRWSIYILRRESWECYLLLNRHVLKSHPALPRFLATRISPVKRHNNHCARFLALCHVVHSGWRP